MADFFHRHGGKICIGARRHPTCPENGWQVVCGTKSPHRCLHLDPSIPGTARVVKVLKAAGVKVFKPRKAAKKR